MQEEDEVDTEKRGIGKRRRRGRGHGSSGRGRGGGRGRGQGRRGRGRARGRGRGRGEAGAGMSNRTATGSQLQPEENSAQNLANHDEQLEVRSFRIKNNFCVLYSLPELNQQTMYKTINNLYIVLVNTLTKINYSF